MIELKNPTNLGAPGPIGGTTASSAAFTQIAVTSTSSSVSALSLTQTVAANSSVVAGINAVNNVSGTLALPNVYTGHLFQITDTSNAFVFGANFQQSLNSSTWKGPKTTLSSNLFVNATSTSTPGTINDYNLVSFGPGIQGGANVNPAFNVSLWAENPVIIVTGTGYGTILGAEYDFNIDAAGSAKNRIGIQIVADGICGTDGADYAYLFGSANSAATWDYGITWYGNSVKPSTGTLIGSQNATSAGFGVDFNNVTFGSSGFAFRSPGYSVGPTGALTYGGTTLTTAVTGSGKMVLDTSPSIASPTVTGILTASGGQIAFPSTQSPSTDVNTLDDYEEGTFTPSVTFVTTGTSSFSYATQNGTYVKIGKLVYLELDLTFTPTIGTGSGGLRITGIPFTISGFPRGTAASLGATWTWGAGITQVVVNNPTSTTLGLTGQGSATAAAQLGSTNMTDGAAHSVRISITHVV